MTTISIAGAEGGLLLPWECPTAFANHATRFRADLGPCGAAECALVDRLIWITWRRQRLELAERATHMAALAARFDDGARVLERSGMRTRDVRECINLAEIVLQPDDEEERARRNADERATKVALKRLERGGEGAYERALAALHPDTLGWWEDALSGDLDEENVWAATAEDLVRFLRDCVMPQDERLVRALAARPAARLQAQGESFDPDRMERLLAIDARLDRQFEKTLSTLLQLQAMRANSPGRTRRVGRAVGRGVAAQLERGEAQRN
ncbi:MAG: hypothetical protein AB7J28_01740 [Hyphomonadaceae bacterium]